MGGIDTAVFVPIFVLKHHLMMHLHMMIKSFDTTTTEKFFVFIEKKRTFFAIDTIKFLVSLL